MHCAAEDALLRHFQLLGDVLDEERAHPHVPSASVPAARAGRAAARSARVVHLESLTLRSLDEIDERAAHALKGLLVHMELQAAAFQDGIPSFRGLLEGELIAVAAELALQGPNAQGMAILALAAH